MYRNKQVKNSQARDHETTAYHAFSLYVAICHSMAQRKVTFTLVGT